MKSEGEDSTGHEKDVKDTVKAISNLTADLETMETDTCSRQVCLQRLQFWVDHQAKRGD